MQKLRVINRGNLVDEFGETLGRYWQFSADEFHFTLFNPDRARKMPTIEFLDYLSELGLSMEDDEI